MRAAKGARADKLEKAAAERRVRQLVLGGRARYGRRGKLAAAAGDGLSARRAERSRRVTRRARAAGRASARPGARGRAARFLWVSGAPPRGRRGPDLIRRSPALPRAA